MKQLLSFTILMVALFSTSAFAQLEIGASYELRDEDPKSGFGLRVQKSLLGNVPMVDLGLRIHFSYFSDENNVNNNGFSYSEDFTNYDFGAAVYGGTSLGLMHPYVGLGLGSENYRKVLNDYTGPDEDRPEFGDDSNIYWNMFIGAKVTVIPLLKPFLEYRYTNKELSKPDIAEVDNGRVMIGVLISF